MVPIGKMSSMLNFPKLDRSNYYTWSDNIMFALQAWLLWLMVNGQQPTPLTPPADPPLNTTFKKSVPSSDDYKEWVHLWSKHMQ